MTYNIHIWNGSEWEPWMKMTEDTLENLNAGDTLPIPVDGIECVYEVVEAYQPKLGMDGPTLMSQDIRVRRIEFPD